MNTAILTYRFRQLWKIVREIPPLYLLLLALMAAALIAGLHAYAAITEGGWVIAVILLFLLTLLHTRRKDYRFIFHVEEKPWRVFTCEYLLLAVPVLLVEWLQGRWMASAALIMGCLVVAIIPQPEQVAKRGMWVPAFVSVELFEIRSSLRRSGITICLFYAAACIGLIVPFLSFAFLFLFIAFFAECYRLSEPVSILCACELPTAKFLHHKLWINGSVYLACAFPVCSMYALLYPGQAWLAVSFLIYGALNICLMVVTKYAYYRPQAKIIAGQFPILLSLVGMFALFLFPVTLFFFIKNYLAARRNLTTWLYAYDT